MYFPWLGQLNQALLADAFVFYSDVQFARGFINRVQLLADGAQQFITVPTVGSKRSLINQLVPDTSQNWQEKHTSQLKHSIGNAPYYETSNNLFKDVVMRPHKDLAALSSASVKRLCEKIFPAECPHFYDSTQYPRSSTSTKALVDICKELGASHYLTGHGAKNYIDLQLFEDEGIKLEFIEYDIGEYPQYSGKHVTSYVSSLDAIARIGIEETRKLLRSKLVPAVNFLN
jgi:hypothetical protein